MTVQQVPIAALGGDGDGDGDDGGGEGEGKMVTEMDTTTKGPYSSSW